MEKSSEIVHLLPTVVWACGDEGRQLRFIPPPFAVNEHKFIHENAVLIDDETNKCVSEIGF